MKLIEFVKEYVADRDKTTQVILDWIWEEEGIDEEYSFDGSPSEFIENYTRDYDCIDDFDIFDVQELSITNKGIRSKIYIKVVRE